MAFLKQHGRACLNNGYNIYPVKPRTKGIYDDDWAKSVATDELLSDWLEDQPKAGISIICGDVIAIDVDVYDEQTARDLTNMAFDRFGTTLRRVGMPPKALLLYRVEEPIKKLMTGFYMTGERKSRVEVLGKGQQFVAFNIHPDTNQPYQWFGGDPSVVAVEDLEVVAPDDLLKYMKDAEKLLANRFKLAKGKNSSQLAVRNAEGEDSDDRMERIAAKKMPVKLERDEIDQRLADVSLYAGDYDFWVQVGMALHHQFRGSEEGLQIWDNWSQDADNYDAEAVVTKWASFDAKRASGSDGVTFATVLHFSNIERVEARWQKLTTYKARIRNCVEASTLVETVAKQIATDLDVTPTIRSALAGLITARSKELGVPVTLTDAKKFLRPLNSSDADPDSVKEMHPWLADWVYCGPDEMFFNLKERSFLTHQAFNGRFNRFLLTRSARQEGSSRPEHTAVDIALNLAEIPFVHGVAFQPADVENEVFVSRGLKYANQWRDTGPAPVYKKNWDDEQARAVEVFVQHVHNSASEKPHILMSFLAHMVQHRGQKIRWAPLLIGPQGSGKSVWSTIMTGVLGYGNSQLIPMSVLASGYLRSLVQCELTVLDELKTRSHKYDIEVALRDLLSNSYVTTTEKFLKAMTQPNHTNFIGTSNYDDAVAIDSGDRRWYVERGVMQTKADVKAWDKANPDYFGILNSLGEDYHLSAAIKGYLLDYKISEEFTACKTSAPETVARDQMVYVNEDPMSDIVRDILERRSCSLLTLDVVSVPLLRQQLSELNVDRSYTDPADRKLPRLLRESLGMRVADWRPVKPKSVRHTLFYSLSVTTEQLRAAFRAYEPEDYFDDDDEYLDLAW